MRRARSAKLRAEFTRNAPAARASAASIASSSKGSNDLSNSPVAGFTEAIVIVQNLVRRSSHEAYSLPRFPFPRTPRAALRLRAELERRDHRQRRRRQQER